ncbi:dehydrogenase [Halobellus sp. Atlit-38R]|jgi:uncharacterized protein (TIGR00106 family)|uniref:MTH1187 family thiamine-binding protein n=1 Tax=Halobellus sp. Atlit-38R TaxID=2282131 RepID=UPI000EF23B35|nr:MTH1187 family thiamine-binding protein [Halobellus sp. Atlit-38R]RLM89317.1 dehydrogenase [Halobellus sp. Atlit-38R]
MTAIARLEVIPIHEGSMSSTIARAIETLEEYDVSYETTATDTIIEADSVEELFAAVQAAHAAADGDRVITSLEIDEQRGREQHIDDRVAAVETALGHRPRRRSES